MGVFIDLCIGIAAALIVGVIVRIKTDNISWQLITGVIFFMIAFFANKQGRKIKKLSPPIVAAIIVGSASIIAAIIMILPQLPLQKSIQERSLVQEGSPGSIQAGRDVNIKIESNNPSFRYP